MNPIFIILLLLWLVANFALGPFAMWKIQEKTKPSYRSSNAQSVAEFIMGGTRQNRSLLLLAILLLLTALGGFVHNTFLQLTVNLVAILTGLSFLWGKKEPKTFGFMALASYLILSGLLGGMMSMGIIPSDFSYSILAILAGGSFIAQRETRKNFGFMFLSAFLMLVLLPSISQYLLGGMPILSNNLFLWIRSVLTISAAILLFSGK